MTKTIPDPVLKEWQEDLDAFTAQATEDLPEHKADAIRSVSHLAGTLIQEVFFLRKQSLSQKTIHLSLHRQVIKLEKFIAGHCEPGAIAENPGTGANEPEPCSLQPRVSA